MFVKMSTTTAFTASALLINNSVPSPKYRASVNGLAMSLGSVSKAIGPVLGANLYAWSINDNKINFYFNYHFTFFVLAILSFLSSLVYSTNDETINNISNTNINNTKKENNNDNDDNNNNKI